MQWDGRCIWARRFPFVHKQSFDGAFDAAEKPLDFGGERRLGFLEGLCILEESIAICKPKTQKSQKFATRKQVPITWITFQAARTHCIVPHRGGDEQNQHNKQREEKRGKKAATVLLSHIVSAWTFGTWGIYTVVVDVTSTYLGGVYQWSRWLMA